MPECPPWLADDARQAWNDVVPQLAARRVLTLADGPALELLASTLAEWRALSNDLQAHGLTYTTTTETGATMQRPRPQVAMRSDAQRRLNVSLAAFGLDPSSRGKISQVPDASSGNPFASLGGAS